ncbi:hypothetical protein Hanom_Chr10g00965501 [Helianthus anomalus]
MSILERGVWDDMFPIEGGGLIHMKLEFVLSDQERNRVHSMRESAIKKKQAEILGSRIGNAENAKFLASSVQRREVAGLILLCLKKHLSTKLIRMMISTHFLKSYKGVVYLCTVQT